MLLIKKEEKKRLNSIKKKGNKINIYWKSWSFGDKCDAFSSKRNNIGKMVFVCDVGLLAQFV
jgi:hypothetical protein